MGHFFGQTLQVIQLTRVRCIKLNQYKQYNGDCKLGSVASSMFTSGPHSMQKCRVKAGPSLRYTEEQHYVVNYVHYICCIIITVATWENNG